MKLIWLGAFLINMVTTTLGMDLLEAIAIKCSCNRDCPTVTCQLIPVCNSGYCQYTPALVGSKCPGQSCSNGGDCDDDDNDFCNEKAECISAFKLSTTVCRPLTGDCDVAEYCTGSSGSCPLDRFASTMTQCKGTSNGGACDGQDMCDGNGNCVDKYLPSSTVCRAAKNECDVAETCTGNSSKCPADAFAALTKYCTGTCNGNPCDGQDLCDGKGNCIDIYLPSSTICRVSKGQCDVAEVCSGTSGFCPTNSFATDKTKCSGTSNNNPCDGQDLCDGKGNCVDMYLPSPTVCRASKGQCDVDEFCTGTSGFCPVDSFASSTTHCTGTCNGNPCDGVDLCDGEGNCVDKYLSSSTVCRPSKGQCDIAETCTGTSGLCPADEFAAMTTTCSGKSTGNLCDAVDKCDGHGNCVDKYLPATTVCRTSKGQCDLAETCTGSSGACPSDNFASDKTTCSGASNNNPCDGIDLCDGKGNCIDIYLPPSSICRASTGQCDVAEICSGTSGLCPVDGFASDMTMCTGTCNGNPCDGDDHCDGKGNCVDVYLSPSTVCRPAASQCDVAELCTGTSGFCPTDNFATATTKCTGTCNGNRCDGQDLCDGKGNCLDIYLPSSTICRPASNQCDVAELCSGTSGLCPNDIFAKASTKCTGTKNGNPCDDQDICDGKGNCIDMYLASSTICRPSKGQCDVAESCSGTSGTCPVDTFASAPTKCTGISNGNACDGQDYCDGNGNCVDAYLPATKVCRPSIGECDVVENCTGSSGQCPRDSFASKSTMCTGECNDNPCDDQDFCDGNGKCVDNYLPSGTVCGDISNPCAIPATCTGDIGFCPPDAYADPWTKCRGYSQGHICDGQDFCDGYGSCVDGFLNGVVCKKPVGYSRPVYCNGRSASCPVTSYLESTNLRETARAESVPASEQLLIIRSSSPLMLIGLACAVAVAAAFLTMHHRAQGDDVEDGYSPLEM
ncbi:hypothetical protein THRCLA_22045 [Thraustotheca clavata]|uniref:Disintegrin domain-containing protein n=1 Tax=Thraustotheca clavata TaxID=74557 RepID=A0A1V9ZDL3_9STRA|nr:hypothetical protein THRCLA_22045 [Thraustotheca clavata]